MVAYRQQTACLKSLGGIGRLPTNLSQHREAHHKTLRWLWDSDSELTQWLEYGSGLFAVTGKPGSGKSVLMNELVTRVRKDYMRRQKPGVVVFHAFSARGAPREHSLDGFLRFAIGQVLRQRPLSFSAMLDEWLLVAHESGIPMADIDSGNWDELESITWPIASLKRALRSIVTYAAHESPVCFLIDALDECDGGGPENTGDLVNYLGLLSPVTISESRKIRVCFSCRDIPSTTDAVLSGGFRMEDRNEPDIVAYINDKWATLAPIAGAGDELKKLKGDLIKKADGIFLWAHLALERIQTALRDGATVAELQETVNDIPDELGGLFSLLLGNINPKYASETNAMLAIALTAQRPLTLSEFRYAVALTSATSPASSHKDLEESRNIVQDDETMKRRIKSRCGGLLEIKDLREAATATTGPDVAKSTTLGHQVVQFMHQSVRDSLLAARDEHRSLVTEGHSMLARACVQYLSYKETHELASQLRSGSRLDVSVSQARLPFLEYAVEACFYHCQEGEKHGVPQAELIDQHFGQPDKDESFQSFVVIHNALQNGSEKYSLGLGLLQLAVEYNLAAYVDMRLTKSADDINALLDDGQTYVQIAVSKSHLETLKVLGSHNADVNFSQVAYCDEAPYRASYKKVRPLVIACQKGSVEMLQVLLEHGAEVSSCTVSHGRMFINQALVAAAYSGNIEVVERLLNADPVTFSHPETRLSAITGLRDAVLEIVEGEPSSSRQCPSKRVEADLEKMQKISDLILCGTDVFQVDFESTISASFFWLLTGCHTQVLQRLADIGTDFTGVGRDGMTFLHAACEQGGVESIRMLRKYGGYFPEIPWGRFGMTCLHLAVLNKKPDVLEHLLQSGLDVDTLDDLGRSPLHDAALVASDEFIDVLLRHGADKTIRDVNRHRPFHLAVSNLRFRNPIQTLQRLLVEESDLHEPDVRGFTPLHLAAGFGAFVVVEWLVCNNANAGAVDDYGRTALHLAASCCSPDSTDVLKCLLDNQWGSLINTRDSADMTPLHHVFWTYNQLEYNAVIDPAVIVANAKLLLHQNADLSAKDNKGNTPLHMAAWRGVKELVKVFLLEGADPHAADVNGLRPLDLAKMDDVREILEDAMGDKR